MCTINSKIHTLKLKQKHLNVGFGNTDENKGYFAKKQEVVKEYQGILTLTRYI